MKCHGNHLDQFSKYTTLWFLLMSQHFNFSWLLFFFFFNVASLYHCSLNIITSSSLIIITPNLPAGNYFSFFILDFLYLRVFFLFKLTFPSAVYLKLIIVFLLQKSLQALLSRRHIHVYMEKKSESSGFCYFNLTVALLLLFKSTTLQSVSVSLIPIKPYKRNPPFSHLAALHKLFTKDHTLICYH